MDHCLCNLSSLSTLLKPFIGKETTNSSLCGLRNCFASSPYDSVVEILLLVIGGSRNELNMLVLRKWEGGKGSDESV